MATIKDVAKRAGVSISTVSNVLNKSKYVSDDLQLRVNEAIAELDYRVDMTARNMKIRNTKIIGVVVNSIASIFIPQIMNGIQNYASERGYQILFYASDYVFEKEKRCISLLLDSKVDGIIVDSVASYKEEEYFRYLSNLKIGDKRVYVVSLERDLTRYGLYSVHVNNFLGGKMATEYLIQKECRNIAVISGPKSMDIIYDRVKGYRVALEEAGLTYDPELIEYGDFTTLSGYLAMKRFITNAMHVDGVFSCNDQMAVGALKALKESSFAIPENVKLIGFDNTHVSSIVVPSLTTINVPKFRMGMIAVQELVDMIEDGFNDRNLSYEIPVNLIKRSTTDLNSDNGIELEW